MDYGIVDLEYVIRIAEGDEQNKWFYLEYYPIKDFLESYNVQVILYRNGVENLLVYGQDYILDVEDSKILFLVEIIENDRVFIRNYEYELLYYKYIRSIRSFLGDMDHTSFIFKNKDLILHFHNALFSVIKPETTWEIEYDTLLNRITTELTDKQLYYLSAFASIYALRAELHRRLLTSIVIRDGVTAIDNTKTLETLKEEIESFLIKTERDLLDELIFGKESTEPFANIDGFAVYASEISQI